MYIEPNTTIKLFKNIPLDNKYEHTLYFASISAQTNYFHSTPNANLIQTLTRQSYQRVNKGIMRIQVRADLLYTCNYLAFQNSNFGNKWFYAFVKRVEYVSNDVSEIEFEIDRIQTYWFDITLKQCFVEREHSATDNIGDNIEPEPVECGEYVFDGYAPLTDNGGDSHISYDLCVLIGISDVTKSSVDGANYDGIYGGAKLRVFNRSDVSGINTYLSSYLKNPDSVVSIYMCPKILITEKNIPSGGKDLASTTISTSYGLYGVAIKSTSSTTKFGNYTPKNNKMYTYPYNYFQVDNGNSQSLAIRYEFCSNLKPQFTLYGCITQPVQLVLEPDNYKNVIGGTGLETTLRTERITLDNYPMCSWAVDTYSAWIAQNSVPMLIQTAQTGVSGIAGILNGQLGSPFISAANLVGGILTNQYKNSIAADTIRGNVSSGNANIAHNIQSFFGGRCRITEQRAKVIDEYFSRFGYATNRVKTPSVNARKIWNYVKTVDCKIIGGAPSDDIAFIENLFNKGITFWKTPSSVGTYSGDNSIG